MGHMGHHIWMGHMVMVHCQCSIDQLRNNCAVDYNFKSANYLQ